MINFYIPNRLKDEKVILILRRHWFVMFKKIVLWFFVGLIPLIFYLLIQQMVDDLMQNSAVYAITVLALSAYYLFVWLFFFYSFVDYYLDVWIVTNERIINIEQRGLFNRTISEQRLNRIQDITSEMKGFFSTMLSYGYVYIQTAGEVQRFVFEEIPQPQNAAKKIMMIVEEYKKFHRLLEEDDKIVAHPKK